MPSASRGFVPRRSSTRGFSGPLRPAEPLRRPATESAVQALQRRAGNTSMARMLRDGARARQAANVRTTFDDCPANAKDVINERTVMAKAWVEYSIRELDAALADPSKADPHLHA